MRGPIVRGLAVVMTVAVFGAAWFFLAPPQLGGKTSYAVTFGISMQPHFHQGDLVILRAHPSYHVGEVVAYHSHDLHRNVLHRIIAITNGHFTFKGDNNNFIDPERPVAGDLVGAEWLHIPTVGAWLASLHSPRNAAIAAFVIVMLLLLTGGGTARRRRHRHRPPSEAKPKAPKAPAERSGAAPSAGFVIAAAGAGALCAAVVVGGLAFTRPLERSIVEPNLYVQHGSFGYSAAVPLGATYQSPRLKTGDPVYLQLVHRLPVSFAYRLQTAVPGPLRGSGRLDATLSDDEGWVHTIVLAPTHPFSGSATVLRGVLDLTRIQKVIWTFEKQTGVHNTDYHLALAAHVGIHGTVSSRPIATTFAPSVAFDLDANRLAVVQSTDPSAPPNTLTQAVAGAGNRTATAYLHAFGRGVTVEKGRRLAQLVGIAGLVLAALGGLLMLMGRRDQEVPAIRRKYEDWIVDVMPDPQRAAAERRVPSMDAIARLAERYERLILHERRDDCDAFLVEDDGVLYAYVVRDWARPVAVTQ